MVGGHCCGSRYIDEEICDGVGTSRPEYMGNIAMCAAGHKDRSRIKLTNQWFRIVDQYINSLAVLSCI